MRKGQTVSAESRAKISASVKRRMQDDDVRTKYLAGLAAKKRKKYPAIAVAKRKYWEAIPKHERSKRLAVAVRLARTAYPTRLEYAVRCALEAFCVNYEAEVRIANYIVDFLLPDIVTVIECDGRFWHSSVDAQAADERRDRALQSLGYSVVRLDEDTIKNGQHLIVLQRLLGRHVVPKVIEPPLIKRWHRPSPMKGKKNTPESNSKRSESMRRHRVEHPRVITKEMRDNMRAAHLGKPWSEKQRAGRERAARTKPKPDRSHPMLPF